MNDENRGQSQSSSRFGAQWRQNTGTGPMQPGRPPYGPGTSPRNFSAQTGPQPNYNTGNMRGTGEQPVYGEIQRGQPSIDSFGSRPGNTAGRLNTYGTARVPMGKPELKDWQKTARSAPFNMNPFEEPDSAPELRDQRNDALYDRSGGFWQSDTSGYVPGSPTGSHPPMVEPPVKTAVQERKKAAVGKPKTGKVVYLLGAVLILALVLVALRFTVFSVRTIRVMGNGNIPVSRILELSGIKEGANILTLDEKRVETGIETDYRLQFRYLEKKIPGEVTLAVREREVVAKVNYCGIIYYLDRQRMVLAESEDTLHENSVGLVEVKGLNIRSCLTGQTLTLMSSVQESVYEELFRELRVVELLGSIREMDLSNTGALYLLTEDDFTVALGSRDNLHAKLHAMMAVRNKLLEMGYHGGNIDVTVPETPAYSPPGM